MQVLIVGAGPAAAGAALACSEVPETQVTMLDVGGRLDNQNETARQRLVAESPQNWNRQDLDSISHLPVDARVKGPPEKRVFGSDFPFRDFGQRRGITATDDVNDVVVSGAYGGFSNTWGAQITPFTAGALQDWPIDSGEMYRHYRAILKQIPYAAEHDDLESFFPVLESPDPLPKPSQRSEKVLTRYQGQRERLRRRGVVLGRARLALNSPECIRCGLCNTGCPYHLIYSASHTLDELRQRSQLDYHAGLLVFKVEEDSGSATVTAKELKTGRIQRFTADRVFLAAGALGTTRLVAGSLGLTETPIAVSESAQFMLPFWSRLPTEDPRLTADFALNQFNMALPFDEQGRNLSQIHFYTYNPAFVDAFPGLLRSRLTTRPRRYLLRRLSVALGYLPSSESTGFVFTAHEPREPHSLPPVTLSTNSSGSEKRSSMLRRILARLLVAAPALDLWPLLPALTVSARGKSYHWGGTFSHSADSRDRLSSDVVGRVRPWRRVHLVDASVFPTVPAMTFTLTIMANAHRIAETVLRGGHE